MHSMTLTKFRNFARHARKGVKRLMLQLIVDDDKALVENICDSWVS